MAESNPTVIPQALQFKCLIRPSSVTGVTKNGELIFLDNEAVNNISRNCHLLHQFIPGKKPTCIAVNDNNLIAVGYRNKAKISPDGSLIKTLPAAEIVGLLDYLDTTSQLHLLQGHDCLTEGNILSGAEPYPSLMYGILNRQTVCILVGKLDTLVSKSLYFRSGK